MGEQGPTPPIAGHDVPWERVSGFFLRLESFRPYAQQVGGQVGPDSFGLAIAELPDPDLEPAQRLFGLPIEHQSDYRSLVGAHLDDGVRDAATELIVLYEPRRGLLGGKRACLHVAAYPAGTWEAFFDAVSRYAAEEFCWPNALFLYQPGATKVFPCKINRFAP